MDYREYYKARDEIETIIKEDLLGPVDIDEQISESPVSYYLVGKLYPRNIAKIEDDQVVMDDQESDFAEDELLILGSGQYPSAIGITFALEVSSCSFTVEINTAIYEMNSEGTWKRIPITGTYEIFLEQLLQDKTHTISIHQDLQLRIHIHDLYVSENYKLTVTLVNNSTSENYSYENLSKATYFQPEILVKNIKGGLFCELNEGELSSIDHETLELELLYHENQNYAIGHGCSATWICKEGIALEVCTKIIPEYDLLQMQPYFPEDKKLFSMKFLSRSTYEQIKGELSKFILDYKKWIAETEKEAKQLRQELYDVAMNNISHCRDTLRRLTQAEEILSEQVVFRAFKYANETMFNQRKFVSPDSKDEGILWYPFQLAFILQEIESIVNPHCREREQVDLLWFPTGGGKTEAYLGLAAFTIFYRRLCELKNNRSDEGVAVIMRYTLRLLSFQQFERASAMICAAELIRRREGLGTKEFGIGLWVGGNLTPNRLKEANDYIANKDSTKSNPIQVTRCPKCGSVINADHYKIDFKNDRMLICCPNERCDFHSGLPIYLIDEEIYAYKPSFLIGTIDKFAQIAFKEEAGELLGIDFERPPELIIQDELHLISGPLGTITGLYEAAITRLCEKDGVKPKIIASTATIRNAENQILGLYGMPHTQFPPQGISINDSYFARLSSRDTKATRKYMGILAPGSSRANSFVRVMGSLLFASRYLTEAGYSDEVVDSFWTETGYFNTLRDLGSAIVRILDNVQDRYQYLKNQKFANRYPLKNANERYSRFYEMTSRRSSADLGVVIQDDLMEKYSKDSILTPIDFLIASNMISVGIDVPRLNTMLVVGQPIKTSEYIQSTSRVGRQTPGLVTVLFHPTLSRDRSHYEAFEQGHAALYKHVEATSLTPFADRARDRALHALYVILCRYTIPELRENKNAKNYRRNLTGLEDIKKYIIEYVRMVDPFETESVEEELKTIETEWENRAYHASTLYYYLYNKPEDSLYRPDYDEDSRFRMMKSMRSVEPSVPVMTMEG